MVARPANLSNAVYDKMKDAVDSGEFPEGLKLPTENALCERYGVSRPVVRGAMERLRKEGYIKTVRGSGSFVIKEHVTPTPFAPTLGEFAISGIGDVIQCQETRMAFEGEMAALAAERWTDEEMEELDAALAQIHSDGLDSVGTIDGDMRFHSAVVKAAKNEYAAAVYEVMKPQILVGMNMSKGLYPLLPEFARRHGIEEHKAILDAIRARDVEGARREMRNHIGFFGDQFK
ncbi:putative L-lactate dehydrogenase operon regulatory protein [Pseudovibrio sp. Ad14]|nr:putative L-lactate dehydrogenase operon regulatory protein [Pseudovibrio sp. W74]KZL03928.1 putative L-lactate dehydrogenase operon regulatory protein [Pseudovibrio sp. Ad14]